MDPFKIILPPQNRGIQGTSSILLDAIIHRNTGFSPGCSALSYVSAKEQGLAVCPE